jgi:hypothetical protein
MTIIHNLFSAHTTMCTVAHSNIRYYQHFPKRSRYVVRFLLEPCAHEPSSIWVSEAAEKWVAAKSPARKSYGWIEEATFAARVDLVRLDIL